MPRLGSTPRPGGRIWLRALSRVVWLVALVALALPAGAVTLAREGRAPATLFLAAGATAPEETAAQELAAYLSQVTGATFTVTREGQGTARGASIYVGPTRLAAGQGIDCTKLGPEEWVMRTVGDSLILAGGRPRGTLYAVYRFLEDVIGVHWWNAYEESVPKQPTLEVTGLDRRGKPVFRYRDIYMLYARDGGRFAARNRLNREGDARISKEYGGGMDYGPPYHVHTFFMYVPPDQYFEKHPEWFSLIKGKRTAGRTQLCLTNQEMRTFFLQRLRKYIADSWAAAKKEGLPVPLVFSVSQNDWHGQCECDNCQKITAAEGSEAGPLLDFVNWLADSIKDEYPEVSLDTLAYLYTQKAPKTMRVRDNVIIRLCDTHSNFTRAITDPENKAFREHLLSWAKIAKNLRIWDYAVTFAPYYGLPLASLHTYAPDYRFYAENNVEGVFTEHEYEVLADMRDLKIWMMMKLLEDPYRDAQALIRQFTDGFYGPAGPLIRDYLAALEKASSEKISYLSMGASPPQYHYLDLDFIRNSQALFDRAEAAVAGDPVLLRRVRHARLPLDRASLVLLPRLMRQWVASGKNPEVLPYDRDAIARRCKATWHAEVDRRIPEQRRQAERARADEEILPLITRRPYVPLPEKFRDLPAGTVFDYTADTSRNWQNRVKVVPDPEAESGITNRLEIPAEEMERYVLPMPWGLYNQVQKKGVGSASIRAEDVPGPGYHWYRMGSFPIVHSTYVYFFWSWIIQVDVDDVADSKRPDQKYAVWARVKFEGPRFPHGKPDQKNAICVERVVLVKE